MTTPNESKPDRRGTFWDWPVGLIVGGVLIGLFVLFGGGTPTLPVYFLIGIGVVALMVRRGAFTPRGKP